MRLVADPMGRATQGPMTTTTVDSSIDDDDIESYVDGYVSGAMTAKAGKPLAR